MGHKSKLQPRSSSLFLLELIIAIMMFALASSVCVQLFVKSHNMSADSLELNNAVNECCTVADIINSSESQAGAADALTSYYKYNTLTTNEKKAARTDSFETWLGKDYRQCRRDKAQYVITANLHSDGRLIESTISAYPVDSNEMIYRLETNHAVKEVPRG